MTATDPVTLAVYDGNRAVHRAGLTERITRIEADVVALEHRETGIIRHALSSDGPDFAARVAAQIVEHKAGMADEVARLHRRVTRNYADVPEETRDLECRVGGWRRDQSVSESAARWTPAMPAVEAVTV